MTDPNEDFPAAHSMDTDWFAVDADGHVGLFESGEDGAVPATISQQDGGWVLFRQMAREAAKAIWTVAGVRDKHCLTAGSVEKRGGLFQVLLFMRDVPDFPVESYESPPVMTVIRDGESELHAVCLEFLAMEVYEQIHADGLCAGCGSMNSGLSNLGLFHYDNDEYDLSPYKRVGLPQPTIKLSDFPESIQAELKRVTIDGVHFPDAPLIQPLEHSECHTWGGEDYLSSDGKTRVPLPGKSQGE